MKKPLAIETGNAVIKLLAVMPIEEDHAQLDSMLPNQKWSIHKAHTLTSAVAQLRKHAPIPLVVCDQDLWPGTWKDLLKRLDCLNDPPFLIVTSRLADEQLWAEALNLGAYDVLAKPFDTQEVNRTLSSAFFRWRDCHALPQGTPLTLKIANA
jgi:DNA-binding response OmpR family regulator